MTDDLRKSLHGREHDDAPFETVRWLRYHTMGAFFATIPVQLTSVGAKAVILKVENIYGEPQYISVPIDDLQLSDPTYPAVHR